MRLIQCHRGLIPKRLKLHCILARQQITRAHTRPDLISPSASHARRFGKNCRELLYQQSGSVGGYPSNGFNMGDNNQDEVQTAVRTQPVWHPRTGERRNS